MANAVVVVGTVALAKAGGNTVQQWCLRCEYTGETVINAPDCWAPAVAMAVEHARTHG